MTISSEIAAPSVDDPYDTYMCELVREGLLIPSGVPGVVGRGGVFEDVLQRFDRFVTRMGAAEGATVMRFPSIMPRAHFEQSGYLKSFPQLIGSVFSFTGNEHDHNDLLRMLNRGEDWSKRLTPTDVVLTPAACYPVYPIAAARGPLPGGGLQFDIEADVFRHEPSRSLDRLQSFRMREFVRIGSAHEILLFREQWLAKSPALAADLGVPFTIEVANDPFFGRVGQVMAISQRQQALKFELLIRYHASAAPTACMSFNYHRDHFGQAWSIRDDRGETAHTGCVAFGIDRLAVALFAVHGLDLKKWPAPTQVALAL